MKFTLLTKQNCPLCEHARDVISRIEVDFIVDIEVVWLETPEGEAIAAHHDTPFPPVLVIDGELHGYGRISEKKLRSELDRVSAPRRSFPGRIMRSTRRLLSRTPREVA